MKITLRVLAIVIMIVGFYGNKAKDFPFVLKLIDGSYMRAKEGIKTLLSQNKVLLPQDKGFKEITEFLRTKLTPREQAQSAIFVKLQRGAGGIAFGVTARPFVELEVYLENSPVMKYNLEKLEKEFEDQLTKKILKLSLWVFWIGVIFNLILSIVDRKFTK